MISSQLWMQLRMEAWRIQFFMSHLTFNNYTYNFVILRLTFVWKNTAVLRLTKKNNQRQLIHHIAKKKTFFACKFCFPNTNHVIILRRIGTLFCSLKWTHASMNMHACALFIEQKKGPNLLSISTWSVLGKQNVQAKMVYYWPLIFRIAESHHLMVILLAKDRATKVF